MLLFMLRYQKSGMIITAVVEDSGFFGTITVGQILDMLCYVSVYRFLGSSPSS